MHDPSFTDLSGGKLTYSYGMGSPQPLVGILDLGLILTFCRAFRDARPRFSRRVVA